MPTVTNHQGNKILIIGYGSIGRRHTKVLSKYLGNDAVEIVTKQQISEYVTYENLNSIEDFDEYNFFVIASETVKHFEQLRQLETLVSDKMILVEKPLFEEAKSYKFNKNRVFVAYNMRFHPILQQIKKRLLAEKVLSINVVAGSYLPDWRKDRDYRKCYSSYRAMGGGVILDLSHEIDYVQWFAGPLIELSAIAGKISDLEIDSDDYMALIGKTKRGSAVSISLNYLNKVPMRQILINTHNSTIFADLVDNTITIQGGLNDTEQHNYGNNAMNESYYALHESLLTGQYSDICSYSEGSAVLNTIKTILSSSKSKGWHEI